MKTVKLKTPDSRIDLFASEQSYIIGCASCDINTEKAVEFCNTTLKGKPYLTISAPNVSPAYMPT